MFCTLLIHFIGVSLTFSKEGGLEYPRIFDSVCRHSMSQLCLLETTLCLALLFQALRLLLLSINFTCILKVKLQYISDWPMIVVFVDKWKLDCGLIRK